MATWIFSSGKALLGYVGFTWKRGTDSLKGRTESKDSSEIWTWEADPQLLQSVLPSEPSKRRQDQQKRIKKIQQAKPWRNPKANCRGDEEGDGNRHADNEPRVFTLSFQMFIGNYSWGPWCTCEKYIGNASNNHTNIIQTDTDATQISQQVRQATPIKPSQAFLARCMEAKFGGLHCKQLVACQNIVMLSQQKLKPKIRIGLLRHKMVRSSKWMVSSLQILHAATSIHVVHCEARLGGLMIEWLRLFC